MRSPASACLQFEMKHLQGCLYGNPLSRRGAHGAIEGYAISQVGKYVPDVTKCKSSDWRGVLESEDVLDEMFLEYIAEPLRKQAVPSSTQVMLSADFLAALLMMIK